jgi:hypothetical protein
MIRPYPIPVRGGYVYVCAAGHTHVSEYTATVCAGNAPQVSA